jgi:hypothetical protein
MKFELIALQNNIWLGTDNPYVEDAYYTWEDMIKDLFKSSDLARLTFENGEVQLAARYNFNAGTCSCCGSAERVKMYEFFRKVG